jgi:hypothetical protein
VELGWLKSSRDEHSQIDLLDASESFAREFRWSRLALSTEVAHTHRAPSRIALQWVPRRLRREHGTAVIPGGELFALPAELRNVGSGRLHFNQALDESLDSWLLNWEDQWPLSTRWQLAMRAGWASERLTSARTDSASSDADCMLRDLRNAVTRACGSYYAEARLTRNGQRSSQIALPSVGLQYSGKQVEQNLGWRTGYGRSRAALELSTGRYRVFAPERIDALEYSLADRDPRPRWRVDLFAYHWRERRSLQRQTSDLGAVLLNESDGGRALATGIEVTTYQSNASGSIAASAGWLNGRYVSGDFAGLPLAGKRLEDAPRYTASLIAAWHGPAGWFADVSIQLAGSSFLDATNQAEAQRPPMRLLDINIGRRIGPWDVFVYGSDLSDGASFQSVIPRNGTGLLGDSYRIVEGPSVGIGIRWRASFTGG